MASRAKMWAPYALCAVLCLPAASADAFVVLRGAPRALPPTTGAVRRGEAATVVEEAESITSVRSMAAAAAAVCGLLLGARRQLDAPQRRSRGLAGSQVTVAVMEASPYKTSSGGSLFAGGAPLELRAGEQVSTVARRSLQSCYTMYFRKPHYKDRYRKEVRNKAYNIFMRNRYKKWMLKTLRAVWEARLNPDKTWGSLAEMVAEFKWLLDESCIVIDEVTVQGVLHRNTAARRKDRLFRCVYRAALAKGLVEKPSDSFMPAYKIIGYEMPKTSFVREPRPWQLPGWKSPWMLRREFEKWRKERAAKATA